MYLYTCSTVFLFVLFIILSSFSLREGFLTFQESVKFSVINVNDVNYYGTLRFKTWYVTAIIYGSIYNERIPTEYENISKALEYLGEFEIFKHNTNLTFWPKSQIVNFVLNEYLSESINSHEIISIFNNTQLFPAADNNVNIVTKYIEKTISEHEKHMKILQFKFLLYNLISWISMIIIFILLITLIWFYNKKLKKALIENSVVEKKKAEAIKNEKNKFIRYVFHEIRNPLQAIDLGLEQLIHKNINEEIIYDMKYSTEIMTQIVNDCLDLQQIEYGTYEIHVKAVSIKRIVEKSLMSVSAISRQRCISIISNLHEYCSVLVDPIRIQQVLINILTNSLKFSPPNSIVKINFTKNGELSIEDFGIGIESNVLNNLNKPFNPEACHHIRGSGLGLSIVSAILNEHKITYSVVSKPGNTRIILHLPITEYTDNESLHGGDNFIKFYKYNILLVDDDRVSLKITKRFLEMNNMTVNTAENGQIAIENMKKNSYDCILMDKEMPIMDGYEATCAIRRYEREQNEYPRVIIGLTGNALHEDQEIFKSKGANDVIIKPLNINVLKEKFDKYLMSH